MRFIPHPQTPAALDVHWSFRLTPAPSGRIFVVCCSMLAGLLGQKPQRDHGERSAAHCIAPRKSAGDFLAKGHAWINPAQTQRHDAVAVAIELDSYRKELVVFGDRSSAGGGIKPFEKMPIVYERAFGGPRYAANPVGCGYGGEPDANSLPNIVYPAELSPRARDCPVPAGFGPLDPTWHPRSANLGTYDEAWLAKTWPCLPHDFDQNHWNEAPLDQRFPKGFRGDERLAFYNMHPDHACLKTQLPACKARAFLAATEGGFHELNLRLDTIDADLDDAQIEMVWRGSARVGSPRLAGIDFLFAMVEPCSADTDLTRCRAMFEASRRQLYPTPAESREAREAALAAAEAESDQKMQNIVAAFQDAAKTTESRAQLEGALAQCGQDAAAAGIPASPARRPDDAAARDAALAQLREQDPERGARLTEAVQRLQPLLSAPPKPPQAPPPPAQPGWTRERVIATHASGGDMSNAELSGIDLSRLDLSHGRFANALMIGVDLSGSFLSHATLTGVRLRGATLTGARFDAAEISSCSFAGLDGTGLRFDGARGRKADFRGARLAETSFIGACLPGADFTETELHQANFTRAQLVAAQFAGATGARISFDDCDLTNLRAHGATLAGLSCLRAKAPNSVWQKAVLTQANFSRAHLQRAILSEADLTGACFDRACMDDANLDDALLHHAILTNARLLRLSLERADLTDANISGSNLYRASLFEARTDRAMFTGSLLFGTRLQA